MDLDLARSQVQSIFEATLSAVDPEALTRESISLGPHGITIRGVRHSLEPGSRLVVIAVGKAAVPMVRGALDTVQGRISAGLAVTKAAPGAELEPIPGVEILAAGHPVPDERSLEAGARVLKMVGSLGPSDLVLVLLSGGGSALVESLVDDIRLGDLVETTRLLLRAGADIRTLNAVRRRLSRIKAGGLARACAPARVVNLIVSDVLGNPLPIIASGPTVDPGEEDRGWREWVRTSVWPDLPVSVRRRIEVAIPSETSPALEHVVQTEILADAAAAAVAAAQHAARLGYQSVIQGVRFAGEAREFGRFWAEIARHAGDGESLVRRPACLIGAGELTVTVRGDGLGGRNTEMALAAGLEIDGLEGIVIASLATDGDDALTGTAGGVVVGSTMARARAAGLDPVRFLARNDSARLLDACGSLVVTGPTGTNVNDIYLALLP